MQWCRPRYLTIFRDSALQPNKVCAKNGFTRQVAFTRRRTFLHHLDLYLCSLLFNNHPPTMSSPAPRRSRPTSVQATPQATRQNVPSSSPLFFHSSPAAPNGNANGTTNGNANMDISSPLKQVSVAGSTPRAPPGGKSRICEKRQLLTW